MKKIMNTILAFAALAVMTMVASCKAQEVYYTTPEANDFEFDTPVAIKTVTKMNVHLSNSYSGFYKQNTDPATKESQPYVSVTSDDYGYYEKVTYKTFVPIVEDVKNFGSFGYSIEKDKADYYVDADTTNGGIMVTWGYDDNIVKDDDDPYDNAITATLKDENGNAFYRPVWERDQYGNFVYDSYSWTKKQKTDDNGNLLYEEVKVAVGYKKPNAQSVKLKVTATDSNDGTNQVVKETTVNYSENSTQTVVDDDDDYLSE